MWVFSVRSYGSEKRSLEKCGKSLICMWSLRVIFYATIELYRKKILANGHHGIGIANFSSYTLEVYGIGNVIKITKIFDVLYHSF